MTTLEFNAQYLHLKKDLTIRAKHLTRDAVYAEDLLQDTIYAAFKNLHQYKEGTNFKSWIMTIMRNSFINDYRKKKARPIVEIIDNAYGEIGEKIVLEAQAITSMTLQELSTMLAKIPDMYRQPFEMHYQGYSYIEIATHFNLPLGTIKSRIHFTRKTMKAAITKNYA